MDPFVLAQNYNKSVAIELRHGSRDILSWQSSLKKTKGRFKNSYMDFHGFRNEKNIWEDLYRF